MERFLTIENAKLFSKNFSGKEGKYNPPGRRNFCVFIDDLNMAEQMKEDGWNIRFLEPRDENEERRAFMQVAVSYRNRPPKVVIISSRGQTLLEEEDINMLDWAEIEKIDMTINPSRWENNGRKGIKAYLRSIFVTIVEDELDEKYSNVPDSAMSSITEDAI
jgi:hypothetical protein